ncbi:MAG: 2-hydroxy-3-oxopropionate reductase [Dehalococcoidia bacterium]|nr:2-hydroxy-3-oxopropionate reductase [Dehalococcoidia bacterium]
MTPAIGFVGLGIMGKPMARNLMKAGYSLTIYNRSRSAMDELAAEGAEPAGSSMEVAERTDIFIAMVPDSPDSEDVVIGPKGALKGAKAGSVIIDMSSIAPLTSQKLAAEAARIGVEMLDAPVSGGEPAAISGNLAIMVGGKQEVLDRCRPILDVMGASVVRVGDVGAGNTVKLANQIIVAANIEAVGEAFVLAQKAGIDPELVFQAIRSGLAGSTVMEAKVPMIMDRNFNPGFRIRLHQKDLHNALLTGKELGVPLPVTGLVQQMIGALMNQGKGENDHSGIVNFIEALAMTEVSKE